MVIVVLPSISVCLLFREAQQVMCCRWFMFWYWKQTAAYVCERSQKKKKSLKIVVIIYLHVCHHSHILFSLLCNVDVNVKDAPLRTEAPPLTVLTHIIILEMLYLASFCVWLWWISDATSIVSVSARHKFLLIVGFPLWCLSILVPCSSQYWSSIY